MNIAEKLPVGTILMWAGLQAPVGFLFCHGQDLSTITYPELYNICSTTYGSSGAGHFNLPDFRGIFPKGAGTTNRALGKDANGNFYAGVRGTYLTDKSQGHKHAPDEGDFIATNLGVSAWIFTFGADRGVGIKGISTPITDGVNGTPRTGLTTEPQSLGIEFIIKISELPELSIA